MANNNDIRVELFGDEQLDKFFNETLTFTEQKNVMLSAYRKAGKPLVDEAKSNLRATRKHKSKLNRLDKSFGMKNSKSKKSPIMLIGARTFGEFKGHHAHLVNDGTVNRFYKPKRKGLLGRMGLRKKGLVSTGRVTGSHFWDKAVESTLPTIEKTMQYEITASLNRLVQRNLKKQAKAS